MPSWAATVLARVLLVWWYIRRLALALWEQGWQESTGALYWTIVVVLILAAAAMVA